MRTFSEPTLKNLGAPFMDVIITSYDLRTLWIGYRIRKYFRGEKFSRKSRNHFHIAKFIIRELFWCNMGNTDIYGRDE